MADYYTMLTTKGLAKVVAALSGGPALQPQSMAVGDGGGPNFYDQYDRDALKQRSSLVNQHWSDDLNLVDVDPNNPAWVVTEGLIPTQVGGWYIREVGIFDIAGDLIAIGVYPETYKPIATAVEADLLVRSILEVGEASVVQLKIDPSQVMATRAWVLESAIPHALTMLDDAVERAEVARDIAQLAVGIFNSEQAGITATSDDDYFWVSLQNEESLVALYKNEGGVADFYGAYPSHKAFELVRQRLEVVQGMAGLAGGLRSGLYKDEEDSPLYGITTKSGQYLAAWDRQGYQINPARKGLIRKDDDPVFSIKNENGIDLYAIDENRQPIVPLIKALYTSDDQPTYAKVDKKGIIFHGIDPTGKKMVGGGDFDSLEINERSASDGELYLNYDQVKKRRDYSSPFFNAFPLEALPDLATWYGYYDSLMENNPDYITRVLLDTDSVGNPIYAYEFTPPDLRKSVSYPIPDNATRLPSIVIVSGTHGIEKTGAFVSLQFAHDLCNSWHSDELARTFRFGVKVVFVPCMVPYGCQENVRKNPNGVDANRNAPAEWESLGLQIRLMTCISALHRGLR